MTIVDQKPRYHIKKRRHQAAILAGILMGLSGECLTIDLQTCEHKSLQETQICGLRGHFNRSETQFETRFESHLYQPFHPPQHKDRRGPETRSRFCAPIGLRPPGHLSRGFWRGVLLSKQELKKPADPCKLKSSCYPSWPGCQLRAVESDIECIPNPQSDRIFDSEYLWRNLSVVGYVYVAIIIVIVVVYHWRFNRLLREKNDLIRFISHEFRTPLNVIQLGLDHQERLLNSMIPEKDWLQITNIASELKREVEVMSNILDEISDFSKIESHTFVLHPVVTQLGQTLRYAYHTHQGILTDKQLELCISDQVSEINTIMDPVSLSNVIKMLFRLINSACHEAQVIVILTPSHHLSSLSSLRSDSDDQFLMLAGRYKLVDYVNLEIRIISQDLNNRFFVSTGYQHLRGNNSTGLELEVASRIMRLQGCDVKSCAINKGWCFEFKIPVFDIPTIVSSTSLSNRTAQGLHLMVVDDSTACLKMMKRNLEHQGATVETYLSGHQAIDVIKKGCTYNLIFMDYIMPKLDGAETVKSIRALGYSGLIYGLTGNISDFDMQTFIRSGVNRVVAKPLNSNHLLEMLTEIKASGLK